MCSPALLIGAGRAAFIGFVAHRIYISMFCSPTLKHPPDTLYLPCDAPTGIDNIFIISCTVSGRYMLSSVSCPPWFFIFIYVKLVFGIADCFGGFEGEPSDKDAQARIQFFFVFVQQAVAPLECVAESLVARRQVARAAVCGV